MQTLLNEQGQQEVQGFPFGAALILSTCYCCAWLILSRRTKTVRTRPPLFLSLKRNILSQSSRFSTLYPFLPHPCYLYLILYTHYSIFYSSLSPFSLPNSLSPATVFGVRVQCASRRTARTGRPLRARAQYRRAVRARARYAWRTGRFAGPRRGQPKDLLVVSRSGHVVV
jgi:hypothetical protein